MKHSIGKAEIRSFLGLIYNVNFKKARMRSQSISRPRLALAFKKKFPKFNDRNKQADAVDDGNETAHAKHDKATTFLLERNNRHSDWKETTNILIGKKQQTF